MKVLIPHQVQFWLLLSILVDSERLDALLWLASCDHKVVHETQSKTKRNVWFAIDCAQTITNHLICLMLI